jgi:hypothetical protein
MLRGARMSHSQPWQKLPHMPGKLQKQFPLLVSTILTQQCHFLVSHCVQCSFSAFPILQFHHMCRFWGRQPLHTMRIICILYRNSIHLSGSFLHPTPSTNFQIQNHTPHTPCFIWIIQIFMQQLSTVSASNNTKLLALQCRKEKQHYILHCNERITCLVQLHCISIHVYFFWCFYKILSWYIFFHCLLCEIYIHITFLFRTIDLTENTQRYCHVYGWL